MENYHSTPFQTGLSCRSQQVRMAEALGKLGILGFIPKGAQFHFCQCYPVLFNHSTKHLDLSDFRILISLKVSLRGLQLVQTRDPRLVPGLGVIKAQSAGLGLDVHE